MPESRCSDVCTTCSRQAQVGNVSLEFTVISAKSFQSYGPHVLDPISQRSFCQYKKMEKISVSSQNPRFQFEIP